MPDVIEATKISGQYKREDMEIFRTRLIPTDFPFTIKRQFPMRLAFAMTITKVQKQSLRVAGLILKTRVFPSINYISC